MDISELYEIYLRNPSVTTDTRKIRKGDLFFALKGPHFNGNAFAAAALEKGASYVVIDEGNFRTNDRMILVGNVLQTLQELAGFHRAHFHIPFIAITGSNGKTTTKELAHAVLSTTYKTYATEGNLNNHIGIPLTLLKIRSDVKIAIIEMGANHQHEIENYCKIVNPTHGIITNVGKAHLEGFGGLEGVRKGKGELFDYLRTHGGIAFACRDFDYFREMTHDIKEVVWYGTGAKEFVQGRMISNDPFLNLECNFAGEINTHLIGAYNIYNVLAAVTLGKYFEADPASVTKAIEHYKPQNFRSQLLKKGDNEFILDAYNANPSSMKAAIENFAASSATKKILMLGAMMELGDDSIEEHQKIVDFIGSYSWQQVVLVGGDFANVSKDYLYLQDAAEARKWLEGQHVHDATILVKGSRSMAMEKILDGSV